MPCAPRSSTAPPTRAVRSSALGLLAAAVFLGAVAVRAPAPAGAAVVHQRGFRATVAGFTSWYGSYGMGALGEAWCIDHGSHAPDAAFGYAPTDVADQAPPLRVAMAWAIGRYGWSPDDVDAAALMLVLHDVMAARYPQGMLDVDTLPVTAMAGFGGAEADVLTRARGIKADALAHQDLVSPYRLTAEAQPVPAGAQGTLTMRITDDAGIAVGDIALNATAAGATLDGPSTATDGSGIATIAFTAGPGLNRFDVSAALPDLVLHAFASTTTPAQRVAVPATVAATATTSFTAEVPTGRVVVHKTGDAEPYLPVGSAQFELRPATGAGAVATFDIGGDGRSQAVERPAGRYELAEVRPPPGYGSAAPVAVDVVAGETVTVDVTDHARRGRARIRKLDAATGAPLAGAELAIAYDADNDGTYETAVVHQASGVRPLVVRDLLPGDYVVTEAKPPAGYDAAAPTEFTVTGGETVDVRIEDRPLPPTSTSTTTVATAPPIPQLPRTGGPVGALAMIGTGLTLIGVGLRGLASGLRRRNVDGRSHEENG